MGTYGYDEEHVHAGIEVFESARVVGEFIPGIGVRGVPEKDALDLSWVVCCHLWIVSHDIAIACVCDQNKFSLWKALEDLVE